MLLESWKRPKGSSITVCCREPAMEAGMVRVTSPGGCSFSGQSGAKTQVLCISAPPHSFASATGTFARCITFPIIPSLSLSAYSNLILQDLGQVSLTLPFEAFPDHIIAQ